MNSDRFCIILICAVSLFFGAFYKFAPMYYFKQGHSYLKNHEYSNAYENFKKAYKLNKFNKDYKYYYVKSMYVMPATLNIQKEMFEIASSEQEDSAQLAAEEKIIQWKTHISNKFGDNYIEQATQDNGILRWDSKKFPLKVYISNNDNIKIPNYYTAEIDKAFTQWQISTNFITFTKVADENYSDITVKISPLPDNVCSENSCKYVVGYTTPKTKKNFLEKMVITLYATDPLGNYFSDKELYNTILHEIGHALGVMGHSYSTGDLMYMSTSEDNNYYSPYRSTFQYLSSKDLNTINLLYKLYPTTTNTPLNELDKNELIYAPIVLGTNEQISSRKLKEAQIYIKKAPNLSSGYIDLGIAYSELNKPKEAIKAMKKAYKLAQNDNEKYIVAFNLAIIYMNNKKYDEALVCAQEAQKISNNEDIEVLIYNIYSNKLINQKGQ